MNPGLAQLLLAGPEGAKLGQTWPTVFPDFVAVKKFDLLGFLRTEPRSGQTQPQEQGGSSVEREF